MVSSDMPELLSASDRIIVMSNGRIAGELTGEERTELKEQTGHKERTTFKSWGLSEEGAGRRNQRTVQVRRSPGRRSV